MMYPYMKFADETEVTFSHIILKDGQETIQVHFERPTETGFDEARCELPKYNWIKVKGYTKKEIEDFKDFLMHNAHLFFKYSKMGGINIA